MGTTKGFWSLLYQNWADCSVKDKFELEVTGGGGIGQEAHFGSGKKDLIGISNNENEKW